MKYYLIVGEASGDLHASNLMKALKVEDSEADFRYYGGAERGRHTRKALQGDGLHGFCACDASS